MTSPINESTRWSDLSADSEEAAFIVLRVLQTIIALSKNRNQARQCKLRLSDWEAQFQAYGVVVKLTTEDHLASDPDFELDVEDDTGDGLANLYFRRENLTGQHAVEICRLHDELCSLHDRHGENVVPFIEKLDDIIADGGLPATDEDETIYRP